MRLDHLLSKETSRYETRSCNVLRLACGALLDTLFNLEGTRECDRSGYGGLAQLGERLLCKQEVIGSIPIISTMIRARSSAG